MSAFTIAVDRLLNDATGTREELTSAGQAVLDLRPTASPDELNEAIVAISELVREYADVSAFFALTAGALVDSGADGTPLANFIIDCLPPIIAKATKFGNSALARALSPEESDQVENDAGGEWIADRFVPSERVAVAAEQDPDGCDAWVSIRGGRQQRPRVTRDSQSRKRAVAELPSIKPLCDLNEGAHRLLVLLNVLEDEPFVVLYPSANAGYRLRVSGVADNFQLQTLLADATAPLIRFPVSFPSRRDPVCQEDRQTHSLPQLRAATDHKHPTFPQGRVGSL